jgi:hypothetical protein
MAGRLCVVDDTDERLVYEGNWSLKLEGVGDAPESSGPSVNYTTHILPSGDGSVDFNFNGMSTFFVPGMLTEVMMPGTQVEVVGTLAGDGNQTSSWQCFIDGQQFGGGSSVPNLQATNYPLCASSTLPTTGPHNLLLNFTSSPGGSPLGLDYIAYTPLDSNWEQCPLISTPLLDANITLGTGWTGFDVLGNATRSVGTDLSFTFTGALLHATSVNIPLTMIAQESESQRLASHQKALAATIQPNIQLTVGHLFPSYSQEERSVKCTIKSSSKSTISNQSSTLSCSPSLAILIKCLSSCNRFVLRMSYHHSHWPVRHLYPHLQRLLPRPRPYRRPHLLALEPES